ncbi:MAG: hypothetical protein MHM6MM_000764 [Cercozoa sp. M6MM]
MERLKRHLHACFRAVNQDDVGALASAIELALEEGNEEAPDVVIKQLLSAQDSGFDTLLHRAAEHAEEPMMLHLLSLIRRVSDAAPGETCESFEALTPQIRHRRYCRRNTFETLRHFFDAENCEGVRPMHIAAQKGKVGVVKLLLEVGASLQAPDLQDRTPLLHGIASRNIDLVKYLLARGAKQAVTRQQRATPLLRALQHGNKEMALLLLDHCASVQYLNECDKTGRTALQWSATRGSDLLDVAQLLLHKGARVDAAAFNTAMNSGSVPLVQLLLEHGESGDEGESRVDIIQRFLGTKEVLHLAAKQRWLPGIVAFVWDYVKTEDAARKQWLSRCTRNGTTALHEACQRHLLMPADASLVNWLLSVGADPNAVATLREDYRGDQAQNALGQLARSLRRIHNPLRFEARAVPNKVAFQRFIDVVPCLLQKGVKVDDAFDVLLEMTQHEALYSDLCRLIQVLVDRGALLDRAFSQRSLLRAVSAAEGFFNTNFRRTLIRNDMHYNARVFDSLRNFCVLLDVFASNKLLSDEEFRSLLLLDSPGYGCNVSCALPILKQAVQLPLMWLWRSSPLESKPLPARVRRRLCHNLNRSVFGDDEDDFFSGNSDESDVENEEEHLDRPGHVLSLYCMLHAFVLHWRDQAIQQLLTHDISCDVAALCADYAVIGFGAGVRLQTLLKNDGCVSANLFFSGLKAKDAFLQHCLSVLQCRCDSQNAVSYESEIESDDADGQPDATRLRFRVLASACFESLDE